MVQQRAPVVEGWSFLEAPKTFSLGIPWLWIAEITFVISSPGAQDMQTTVARWKSGLLVWASESGFLHDASCRLAMACVLRL